MIVFTRHAKEKFLLLKSHGVTVTEKQVRDALEVPYLIDHSRFPLLIAQIGFDAHRVLRVVYKQGSDIKTVITSYPGRRKQYEKN